jgi:hypothetical protein
MDFLPYFWNKNGEAGMGLRVEKKISPFVKQGT